MPPFEPDYANLVLAARNIEAPRLPLYEHFISISLMETLTGSRFADLLRSDDASDRLEYFSRLCRFYSDYGYDAVSFECMSSSVMPGAGHLGGHGLPPGIRDRADVERYPWAELPDAWIEFHRPRLQALRKALPPGMKAVGGVGYGVFELAQDVTGFEALCYMLGDDEECFALLTSKIGATLLGMWQRLLREFGDIFCVCRFGDDLGYKTATMLAPDTLRRYIFPHYKPIIELAHSAQKPFLLHSCGNLLGVMEDILAIGIDAKHSNEDAIAPFSAWVERYGDRIGNFGGIDTDHLCRMSEAEIREEVRDSIRACKGHGGIAFGSGNSIADYVPPEGFLAMVETAREMQE